MNALILTCSIGQGHNSAAMAVYEELKRRGNKVEIIDEMNFMKGRVSHRAGDIYVNIISGHPKAFGKIYNLAQMASIPGKKSPVYFANSLYAKKLLSYINSYGFDTIIMSHFFPMEAVTYMRKHYRLSAKCYGILTDYTLLPLIEETDLDGYFLPFKLLKKDCVKNLMPIEKLIATGIPVSDKFNVHIPRREARSYLGLNVNAKIFLIMTGCMGYGDAVSLCRELLIEGGENTHVVVLAGRNQELLSKIESVFGKDNMVTAVPFTYEVNVYMDACDVILTKPGGLTSTEAAVCNIPIIHTNPIPGCEDANAEYFYEKKMSLIGNNPYTAAVYANMLFIDKKKRNEMLEAQRRYVNPRAAADICSYVTAKSKK